VRQLLYPLNSTGLLYILQSAYQANHPTETTVLKVLSDILLELNSGDLSALILLDLSAALTRLIMRAYCVDSTLRSWSVEQLSIGSSLIIPTDVNMFA